MTYNPAGKRLLAIVPHQDDEVIGMGGQLALAARVARSVHLVLVTDGAADGGVKSLLGDWPCRRLADIVENPSADLLAHDASLVQAEDGSWQHRWATPPPFVIRADRDRAPGFECLEWGRQRDAEFLDVAQTLGIPQVNIILAQRDAECPERIKDGQIGMAGHPLAADDMAARYAAVARHYIDALHPEIILTMAPYENLAPPNDHWSMAHGVHDAAAGENAEVLYNHSGQLYRKLAEGGAPCGIGWELSGDLWAVKQRAILRYFQWNPEGGRFATAAHSVPQTFACLLGGLGRVEYISRTI